MVKQGLSIVCLSVLFSFAGIAFAQTPDSVVLDGDVHITNGSLVFPDGTLQSTATLQGPAGPANSLSVGTVTTGAPGSAAAATITGTPPSQVLNLTIPQGSAGPTGPTGPQGPVANVGFSDNPGTAMIIPGNGQIGVLHSSTFGNFTAPGVIPSSTVRCGPVGCMIAGLNAVEYVRGSTVNSFSWLGQVAPSSQITCGGAGCIIPGTDQTGFLTSNNALFVATTPGVTTSSSTQCSGTNCMIAGNGIAVCLAAGVSTVNLATVFGVLPSSTLQCNAAGCMVAGIGVIGYCLPGSTTITVATVPGVLPTSVIGK